MSVALASPETDTIESTHEKLSAEENGLFEMVQPALILGLPDELLSLIFAHFAADALCTRVALVCRRFNAIVHRNGSPWWRRLDVTCTVDNVDAVVRQLATVATTLRHLTLTLETSVAEKTELKPNLLSSLHTLCLNWTEDYAELIGSLWRIAHATPNLRNVIFDACPKLSDEHMPMTRLWCHLRSVRQLHHSSFIHCEGLRQLSGTNKNMLHTVYLLGSAEIRDNGVRALCEQHGASLRCVALDAYLLSDDSVQLLCQSPLILLSLDNCGNFSDVACEAIATLAPTLRHLHLLKASDISTAALLHLFDGERGLCHLHHLAIRCCTEFNDQCIASLASCARQLRTLSIAWNYACSDKGIAIIVKQLRHLQLLDLQGLDMISGWAFRSVPHINLPRLRLLCGINCNSFDDDILLDMVKRGDGQITACDYFGSMYNARWLHKVSTNKRRVCDNADEQNEALLHVPVDNAETPTTTATQPPSPPSVVPVAERQKTVMHAALKSSVDNDSDIAAPSLLWSSEELAAACSCECTDFDQFAVRGLRRLPGACCCSILLATLPTYSSL